MKVHVKDLLLARQEEGPGQVVSRQVDDHLAACSTCRAYATELERNDGLLSLREGQSRLPPFRLPPEGGGRTFGRVTSVLVGLGVVALALVLGNALREGRVEVGQPSTTPEPTSQAPTGDASGLQTSDRLVFIDRSANVLILADTRGSELARTPTGGGVFGQPAIDPSGTFVAYWRATLAQGATQVERSELLRWDLARNSQSVLLQAEGMPLGRSVWLPDGERLVFVLGRLADPRGPETPPVAAQLSIVDVRTREVRTIQEFREAHPVIPIASDGALIAGTRKTAGEGNADYVVIDVMTGAVMSSTPAAIFQAAGSDAAATVVWGQIRSGSNSVLRVWRLRDYTEELARAEVVNMTGAAAWPGRTEIVFGSGSSAPYGLKALDYASGALRSIGNAEGPVSPLQFSSDGTALALQLLRPASYALAPAAADRLGTPVPYELESLRYGGSAFVGWLRREL